MVSTVDICAYSCTPLDFGLYLVVIPPKTRPDCGESYRHFVKRMSSCLLRPWLISQFSKAYVLCDSQTVFLF